MKKSFVPISKQSKKAQKAYHSTQRSTWGILNPATRTMPNGRAYNRKKQKAHDRSGRESKEDSLSLLSLTFCFFRSYALPFGMVRVAGFKIPQVERCAE